MAVKKTVKRTVTTRSAEKPTTARKSSGGTGKKKPAKSAAKAKKTPGPADELKAMLPQLSPDEITWLITQARTMIYNHKVEEVNKAGQDLVETRKRKKSSSSGKTSKKVRTPDPISIEPTGNGRSFVLIMGGKRLFLSLKELKDLVKLTQVTDDASNASRRIYAWMERERMDMVNDAAVSGPGDARLAVVFDILREKFTVG